jgi:anti-sigma factor RsiW
MTEHVDEGRLQAWLDDELRGEAAARVARHLERCVACRDQAQALRTLERQVTAGLRPLDGPVDPEARWKIRQRRGARKEASAAGALRRRRWSRRRSVAAAAVLVLVAGGAAALPGSPIRSWIAESMREAPTPEVHTTLAEGEPVSGVAVGLRDGRVEVVFHGPRPAAEVEVRVGGVDRVEVQAPAGTRYSTAPGRVEADLGEAAGGTLLILIPGSAREVSLAVGRRPIMTWSGGTFRLEEGVPAETRGEGLLIRLPAPDAEEE